LLPSPAVSFQICSITLRLCCLLSMTCVTLKLLFLRPMCEGKCVTSAGNRIEADYEVTKLAAVIDVLENKFYLPVSRVKIPTASDTGGGTIQAKYLITENDMQLLLEDPESVVLMRERLALSKLKSRDERCLKRLVSVHGYDEVFERSRH
ncbi:hypothetical protein SU67_24775, partial [Escherichia coli O139:H28 str. E24377A]